MMSGDEVSWLDGCVESSCRLNVDVWKCLMNGDRYEKSEWEPEWEREYEMSF